MPIERVRGPDGKVHRFRVPDGTTPEEVMRIAEQQFSTIADEQSVDTGPQEPTRPEEAWYEDFGEGIVASGLDTVYGIKDLVTDLSDEERARLKDWKEDAGQSGWGTAGRVVGEIGQLAVPGAAGIKAARALNAVGKAAKTARALPLAADVAGSAGLGYVQLPDDAASRGQEAWQGGAAALAGGALGTILSKAIVGAKGSQAAQNLRDKGAKLTLGQVRPGIGFIEDLTTVLPVLGKSIRKLREKSDDSLHKLTLREAAPPTPESLKKIGSGKIDYYEPKGMGQDAVDDLYSAFERSYDSVWGNVNKLKPRTLGRVDYILKEGLKDLGDTEAHALRRVQRDLEKLKGKVDTAPSEIDRVIRRQLGYTAKTREPDLVLRGMRKALRSGLPKDSQKALKAIDKKYPNYKAVENAAGTKPASMSAKDGGIPGLFNPEQALGGALQTVKKPLRGRGKYPMRQLLTDQVSVQTDMPGIIGTYGIRKRQAIPDISMGMLARMNQQLAGNYPYQKRIREALQEELAKRLRYTSSSARIGGALEGENY
jgi:hypothetical protein